jgi:hypothetical protein
MEGFKQAHCASRDPAASKAQTTEWPKHKPMCQSRRNAEVSHCHTPLFFRPAVLGAWWCCAAAHLPPAPAVCTPQRQASGDGSLPGQWGDGGSSAGVPGSRLKGVAHPHRSINATRMPAALAFSPDDDHAGLRRIGASLGRRSGSGSGEEALPSVLTMPAARQSPADVS